MSSAAATHRRSSYRGRVVGDQDYTLRPPKTPGRNSPLPCRRAIDAAELVRAARHDPFVPRISQFYGIAIYMYFTDHPPAHFHAQYGGEEAVIAIRDGSIIHGAIPDRQLRLVREWLELRRDKIEANWLLATEPAPLNSIDPLP